MSEDDLLSKIEAATEEKEEKLEEELPKIEEKEKKKKINKPKKPDPDQVNIAFGWYNELKKEIEILKQIKQENTLTETEQVVLDKVFQAYEKQYQNKSINNVKESKALIKRIKELMK